MLTTYIQKIGLIYAVGSDRMDFFNRMSSNDLTNFPINTYRKTVFTNDKGRIVDFVMLFNLKDRTLIQTSLGKEEHLISHLEKYIITDDVKLEKPSDEFYQLIVWGDDLPDEIQGIEIKKDNSFVVSGENLYAYYDGYKTGFVNIISLREKLESIATSLPDVKRLSDEEFEIFRIDNGIALADNEINENINPVECGLNDYISYDKGCYIGQEVISRLDSQGKVPKQMVKIISTNRIKKDDKIFSDDGKEVGFISSTAKDNDETIGLGFIRSVNLDFGKDFSVKHDDKETKVKISKVI